MTAPERERWWRSGLLWTAIGAVIGALSLLVAAVALLFPPNSNDEGTAAPGTPASTSVPVKPSTTATQPLPPDWAQGDGVVFTTGSPTLTTKPERSDREPYTWNADTNKGWPTSLTTDPISNGGDIVLTDSSLGTQHGAVLALWQATGRPTLATCAAMPSAGWTSFVENVGVAPRATFCFISRQGRYGYLTVNGVKRYKPDVYGAAKDGLAEVTLSYVLWKKPGD